MERLIVSSNNRRAERLLECARTYKQNSLMFCDNQLSRPRIIDILLKLIQATIGVNIVDDLDSREIRKQKEAFRKFETY